MARWDTESYVAKAQRPNAKIFAVHLDNPYVTPHVNIIPIATHKKILRIVLNHGAIGSYRTILFHKSTRTKYKNLCSSLGNLMCNPQVSTIPIATHERSYVGIRIICTEYENLHPVIRSLVCSKTTQQVHLRKDCIVKIPIAGDHDRTNNNNSKTSLHSSLTTERAATRIVSQHEQHQTSFHLSPTTVGAATVVFQPEQQHQLVDIS